MEVTVLPSQFVEFKQPSKNITFENFTITYALNELFTNYKFIYDWIIASKNPESFGINERAKADISLHILTNKKNPKATITFIDAFPVTLSEVPFTYVSDNADDVLVSATFAYNYFRIENGN